jgi:hypothetical protein
MDIYGPSFANGQPNSDVIFSGSSSSNVQANASNQSLNGNFVKLEDNEHDAQEVFIKTDKTKSFSPNNKLKLHHKNAEIIKTHNFEHENNNEESGDDDDDDEVDLSNPEITFINAENTENINEHGLDNENSSKFIQFNPITNLNNNNNQNNNLKLVKKTKSEMESANGNEADVDTVNSLYNKLLIHNTANKNFSNSKMGENGVNSINEDNVRLF